MNARVRSGGQLDDPIAEAAATWIVQLSADDEFERAAARVGFDAWKQADSRHREAAARIEGFIAKVHGVSGAGSGRQQAARAAIVASSAPSRPRRRTAPIGGVLVALFSIGLAVWTLSSNPASYWLADVRTDTGVWTTQTLGDGSRITLSGASAANVYFDARSRTLELVSGDVLVDVARDPERPFAVTTPEGSVRALGTRFVVSREADQTVLTMLESKTSVKASAAPEARDERVVSAGERVRITRTAISPTEAVDAASVADAWKLHQLVLSDASLPDVLDRLSRERAGRISYDRTALASIKVSAVLPLDDTDRALQLLSATFPKIRVRSVTPYLVFVDLAPSIPTRK